MSQTPQRLAGLSPQERRALLARLMKDRAAGPKFYPLSFAQQRLWFLDQLEEASGTPYRIQQAWRLRGDLDAGRLEQALRAVAERHEALRTVFVATEGKPLQAVSPRARLVLPRLDLSALPAPRREPELQALLRRETARPFDLGRGPLLRTLLVRLESREFLLFLHLHHIIADAWSLGILAQELSALYRSETPSLPPLATSYGAWAAEQRRQLEGEVLERQIAWWRQCLEGSPALLELPLDRPRPATPSYRGGLVSFTLPGLLLEQASRRRGATPFMVLLAGFQALLSRHSGQRDVVVGTPAAGRRSLETESLIGFFVNTLVLRADLSGEPSFSRLVERVASTTVGAYDHQDLPFDRLVEALRPQRDPSYQPIFQVLFQLQTAAMPPLDLGGVEGRLEDVDAGVALFDLGVFLEARDGGLRGLAQYSRDLFDRSTVQRLVGQLSVLLKAALAEPERSVFDLPLLAPAQRHQLLVDWNDTTRKADHGHEAKDGEPATLPALFEAQVRRQPEAPALVTVGERLSYAELNRRANRVAHRLLALGIRPEDRVAVCMERGADLLIALMAVLKAGGAYVPIDPVYPTERQELMLGDSGARVIVGHSALLDRLPLGEAVALRLDADAAELANEPEEDPGVPVPARGLAYLIYTSGSTGRPKGVAIEHASAVELLRWSRAPFDAAAVRMLASTSVCFDLSVFELFLPLAWGGQVVLVGSALDVPDLAEDAVDVINTVPSAIAELVRLKAIPPSVHTVNLAGEPLKRELVEQVYGAANVRRVFNLYGPSEDTTYSTYCLVPAGLTSPPTIGRPLSGTRAFVVDSRFRPVPPGVAGELLLGGLGLARGYHARGALSAERFVPDSLSGGHGERLYRTGDLVRLRRDGEMEFLGRIDHQVKLKGFRIELGEIEAAIERFERPLAAAVLVREVEGLGPSLVAYAMARDGVVVSDPEALRESLRAHLKTRLPEYMVPTLFVFLEQFPLTPNGKVDRKRLPAPEGRPGGREDLFVAPRNAVEESLAAAWCEVLALERVGVLDDFFELGGHSLLATQVVSRIRRDLEVRLPVRVLFEAPTVAALARRVEEALPRAAGELLPAAPPAEAAIPRLACGEGSFVPSFAQERLWFFQRLLADSSVYNLPEILHLRGALDLGALGRALRALTRRQGALRTRFEGSFEGPRQIVEAEPVVSLAMVDISQGASRAERLARARALAAREARRSFDLATAPLARWLLLRLGEDDHLLVLTMHHIVSDGWSLGVLLAEFGEFYTACRCGREAALAPLPVRYTDFAAWQREWLQGDVLAEQIGYWRTALEGAPAVLELPADRQRPAVQSFRGGLWQLHLPVTLAEELTALARRSGTTLYTVLLAAFRTLLFRYTGHTDLAVGSPIAGRNRLETEALVGFFVNTLVLRTRLERQLPFVALVARERETALGAQGHQDLPFEKLVEELRPPRDLSRTPLFQVMFSQQDGRHLEPKLPDLEVGLEALDSRTSKFDLTLHLQERTDGLAGALEYSADLFDVSTMARMAQHVETLLRAVVADPGRAVADLDLLPRNQRRQVVEEWNATARDYGRVACLHEIFEAQVRRTPEAPAVIFRDRRLTYAELDERANRLAHRLRRLGVGPDQRVGVCLERSLEMVVALYGVLKAGGAYVPLDPDYPADRLTFMVEDSRVPVLITTPELLARPGLGEALTGTGAQLVALEEVAGRQGGAALAAEPATPPAVDVTADNLAYVIYTSGSTGRPKGAMNSHRGIFNRLRWMQEAFRLDAADRVLQKTPFSFDVSVWEFFWPLQVGATLVVAEPAGHKDPAYLVRTLREAEITTLHFVPSMLQVFLAGLPAGEAGGLPRLRRVVASGEALPPELVRRFLERLPGVALDNLYGPTEAAVDVTWWPCLGAEPSRVPIGRTIANTRIYVLDRQLRPVPIGLPGELLIGGVQLARGYHGRPALTAEKFVPDPLSAEAGARLYRTGDEVRFLADGNVEFLGRIDFQVKLRGLRIELGEIEAQLAALPQVAETLVLVREDVPGDQRLVAYLVAVPGAGEAVSEAVLRESLLRKLPDYMVPTQFVVLDAFPLSPNGKVERRALPVPAPAAERRRPARSQADDGLADPVLEAEVANTELIRTIGEIWQEVLGIERVRPDENFFDLGGHSLLLARVQGRLTEVLGRELSLVELFQYPTIGSLAEHLEPRRKVAVQPAASRRPAASGTTEIAIIALNGRFPGAVNVEELWSNLREGVESISFFDDDELEETFFGAGDPEDPSFVKAGGVLEGIDLFDSGFFGYTPREAEIMDPQQRLFLECSWEVLERAGYDPERFGGRIGVFAGSGMNSYVQTNLLTNPKAFQAAGPYQVMLANDKDFLPTRVSYKLNLKGPSVNVQTACSTSLVAVHMAAKALERGECDLALAGGSTVRVPQRLGYYYEPGMINSPDGHCRAFDAAARGTVAGNGVAVVALKRLEDALADGDHIHAVIKGSAINNDGSLKVGYTAPSVEGQAQVIAEALAAASVPAESIGFIEAHGTGTELGDPIEVAALTQAFRPLTERRGFCALGSVKTNVGHLDTAAGVTGLIKAALAVEHGVIPPSLHFKEPNPEIDFASSPFFVNTEALVWPRGQTPRRAGVSSFGIGGTNVHAVLEQAPAQAPSGPSRRAQLLVLSARSALALEQATDRLAAYLADASDEPLADVAFTLQVGRRRFEHRRFVVSTGAVQAGAASATVIALQGRDAQRVHSRRDEAGQRPVVFLFPGQGSQYAGMGTDLYEQEETYRQVVDRCCALLEPLLELDLRRLLMPAEDEREAAGRKLQETRFTQPALFVVEYALARLWIDWGVRPASMIGHSIGEYVAACLAGVFSLEDALTLVAARGRLMQAMAPGAMLSVPLAEEELLPRMAAVSPELALAAVNAPRLCAAAGPAEAVDALAATLEADGLAVRRLRTSHAFHTAMMEPALPAFRELLAGMELGAPRLPWVSNLTGRFIIAEEATDPEYWCQHLRQAVRFADGLALLLEEPEHAFLEVGPGRTLATLLRQQGPAAAQRVVAGSLRAPKVAAAEAARGDDAFLLEALGRLWLAGVRIDWPAFYAGEERRRIPLPTYPFERQRYWVEPQKGAAWSAAVASGRRLAVEDAFYLPAWQRTPSSSLQLAPPPPPTEPIGWLILLDRGGVGAALAERLRARFERVVTVERGTAYQCLGEESFVVRRDQQEDYERLLEALAELGPLPSKVLFLWSLDGSEGSVMPSAAGLGAQLDAFTAAQQAGLYSLLRLARALIARAGEQVVDLGVVGRGLHDVDGHEALDPAGATVLGLAKVLQQEHPNLSCRTVDLDDPRTWGTSAAAEALEAEMRRPPKEDVVAFRSGRRWVQVFHPCRLAEPRSLPSRLRPRGVYLITGGLGQIGLLLAEDLAREVRARLVLVGRSAFPAREDWDRWLAEHGQDDPVSRRIERLRGIEALGAEVLVVMADVADPEAMKTALDTALHQFGTLHGVIHGAGVVGGKAARMVAATDPAFCKEQFRPKALGLMVLDQLLRGRQLDFSLAMSSISSVLGGIGFAAYAAANVFLDAFIARSGRRGAVRWQTLNWDGWSFEEAAAAGRAGAGQLSLRPAEGLSALHRLLDLEPTVSELQMVIAASDLQPRLDRWLRIDAIREATRPAAGDGLHARPELSTDLVLPTTATEGELATLWRDLLGIEQIGIHDDFFELGGHSLLATQLLTRLRDRYRLDLSLTEVFENPTIASMAALVEGHDETQQVPPIEPVPRDRPLRLSFAQERLWFWHRLNPESIAYNLPAAIRLEGRLDVRALRACFDEIVRRHEILRTLFVQEGGQPVQVILPEVHYPLPVIDLGSLPREARDAELERVALLEIERPFDLERGPILRNALIRLAAEDNVLLSACHHIVSDGWSGSIYIKEIAALYEAFAAGKPSPLPAPKVQYADFAAWQRQWLHGEVLEAQLAYWLHQLADLPAPLALPVDRLRRTPGPALAGRSSFQVPGETAAKLRRLAQETGTTLFMISLAAFQTLLMRYSGQTDVLVGTPIANRHRSGTEELVGVFINTLVIRTKLDGDPGFREVLERIRKVTLDAYAHQDLPFEKLIEALMKKAGSGREIFQVMMAFNHEPPISPQLTGLKLSLLDLENRRDEAIVDVAMGLTEVESGLEASVQFNRSLFEAATIQRFFAGYQRLLEGIAADAGIRLSHLDLISRQEAEQLASWGQVAPGSAWASELALRLGGLRNRRLASLLLKGGAWLRVRLLGTADAPVPAGGRGEICLEFSAAAARRIEDLPLVAAPEGPADQPRLLRTGLYGRFVEQRLVLDEVEAVGRDEPARGPREVTPSRDPRQALRRETVGLWEQVASRKAVLPADQQARLKERLRGKRRRKAESDAAGSRTDVAGGINLVRIQPSGHLDPFYCVHAIAGDVTFYVDLAGHLGEDRPFLGLQATGADGLGQPLQSIEEMASRYVATVRQDRPHGPYLIGGWSMGAVVAWEMACQLQEAGQEIGLLVLLEPSVPGCGAPTAELDDSDIVLSLAQDLESFLDRPLDVSQEELLSFDPARQQHYLLDQIRRVKSSLFASSERPSPILFEVYKTHLEALNHFTPRVFRGPVSLFTARQRPQGGFDAAREFWVRLATGGVYCREIPGNHTTMLRDPFVRRLADELREQLAEASIQQIGRVSS